MSLRKSHICGTTRPFEVKYTIYQNPLFAFLTFFWQQRVELNFTSKIVEGGDSSKFLLLLNEELTTHEHIVAALCLR